MQKSIHIHSSKIINAYNALVFGIEGLVVTTLSSPDIIYPKTRVEALKTVLPMVESFMSDIVKNTIATVTEEAARDVFGELSVPIPANVTYAAHQKNVEVTYNLAGSVGNVMRNLYMSTESVLKRGAIERVSGVSISSIDTKIEKSIKDKINRSRSVVSFMETSVKKHIVDAYLNAYTTIASEMGHDIILLDYASPEHRNDGLKLSISGYSSFPTVESMRKEVFHPNTQVEIGIFK